jgi:hypothetical protein
MNIDTLADLVYLAECADAAYSGRIPKRLPFENHGFMHDDQAHYHRGFMGQGPTFQVLAVRGTKSIEDFLIDATFRKVPFLGHSEWLVHEGFNNEFVDIWPNIERWIKTSSGKMLVCGHSMGAAVGALVAFALKEVHNIDIDRAVLPGCPRVGNAAFAKAYNERVPMTWRIVDDWDLVPHMPRLGYWHFNHLFHLAPDGTEIPASKSALKWLWNTFRLCLKTASGESLREHSALRYVKVIQKMGWGRRVTGPDIPNT